MSAFAVQPKPAASLVLCWDDPTGPLRFLMGRRSAKHRFMPLVYVFPGGRVEQEDNLEEAERGTNTDFEYSVRDDLDLEGLRYPIEAFCQAAIRELDEETGLVLGDHLNLSKKLHLFQRAITPDGSPIRYDTLFLIGEVISAKRPLATTLQDSEDNELDELAWYSLQEIEALDLAGITKWVLKSALSARGFANQPYSVSS